MSLLLPVKKILKPKGRAHLGGAPASSFADGEVAPSGFHWEFVIEDADGSRTVDDVTGQPVVDLVAN